MGKKQIIIILSFSLVLVAAFFGWKIFSGKKSVNIVSKTETNNQQLITNNEQQAADSIQNTENNNQQVAKENNSQDLGNNNQTDKKPTEAQPVIDNKKSSPSIKIISRLVSWGFKKVDSRSIDTIVIHSNYNTLSDDVYSISGAIEQFKTYGVAAHYIIDRSGTISQLVSEKNIAYHAGVSQMKDGRTNVNNFSIGIEIMTKDSKDSPTAAEYKALNSLISDIKKRWPIKYVVGHSDIAPDRKTDPWGFDWNKVNK